MRCKVKLFISTNERAKLVILLALQAIALCGKVPSGSDQRTGVLHVDHDHTTKAVRSLLCFACNHGIGNFRDDPALLLAALEYLGRHGIKLKNVVITY